MYISQSIGVVEPGPVGAEPVDIGLQKIELLRIERLEVLVEHLARQVIVQRHGLVVKTRQQFRGQPGRLGFLHGRRECWRKRDFRTQYRGLHGCGQRQRDP